MNPLLALLPLLWVPGCKDRTPEVVTTKEALDTAKGDTYQIEPGPSSSTPGSPTVPYTVEVPSLGDDVDDLRQQVDALKAFTEDHLDAHQNDESWTGPGLETYREEPWSHRTDARKSSGE